MRVRIESRAVTDIEPDIAMAWAAVESSLAASGAVVFPEVPLPGEGGLSLLWPDQDCTRFLAVAKAAGARVIYARPTFFEESELPDADEHPELYAQVRQFVGQLSHFSVAFVIEGVLHVFTREEPWLAAIEDELGMGDDYDYGFRAHLATREAEREELERLQPQISEWATMLSEHPEYLGARSRNERTELAWHLIPQLREWYDGAGGDVGMPVDQARRKAAYKTANDADTLVDKVRWTRLADARKNQDQLFRELLTDPSFAMSTTWRDRERCAADFVIAKLGFASTDIRNRLLADARRHLSLRAATPTPALFDARLIDEWPPSVTPEP
jgi:hypothetical protein